MFFVVLTLILYIHYNHSDKVFLMPAMLILLPVFMLAFSIYVLDTDVEALRGGGWLPEPPKDLVYGPKQYELFDPAKVRWSYLPVQVVNLVGREDLFGDFSPDFCASTCVQSRPLWVD